MKLLARSVAQSGESAMATTGAGRGGIEVLRGTADRPPPATLNALTASSRDDLGAGPDFWQASTASAAPTPFTQPDPVISKELRNDDPFGNLVPRAALPHLFGALPLEQAGSNEEVLQRILPPKGVQAAQEGCAVGVTANAGHRRPGGDSP